MIYPRLQHCQTLLERCHSTKGSSYIHLRLFEAQLNLVVREEFVRKFWSYFDSNFDQANLLNHKPFVEAVEFLDSSCRQIEELFCEYSHRKLKDKFFAALKTQILSEKPYFLGDYMNATYMRSFRTYLSSGITEAKRLKETIVEDDEVFNEFEESDFYRDFSSQNLTDENLCRGCSNIHDNCECKSFQDRISKMNKFLKDFELLEGLVGETVMDVGRTIIERRVATKCKMAFSASFFAPLTAWIHDIVSPWVAKVYGLQQLDSHNSEKLRKFLNEAYAEVRLSQMFEIIIEYPNSEMAITDLQICLNDACLSDFRINLINSVKQSLVESLLHPGVNTYDILTAYISAIKALRALDPSGLILQLVTEPVRRYLKSRDDTVRCIVTALTDEDHNSELNREMIKSSTQTNENGLESKTGSVEMNLPCEGEKCTAKNFETWKPDPIKLSSSDDLMKSSRFSDIVSILVNIYETKDLFVEEYQKLLSQRLLNKYDECNLETELRNLELLTIRFSDCELHRCEVMLKDVHSSKRINKRILFGDIKEHKLDNFKNLDVLIVSSPFWPDKFGPMTSISEEPPEIKFPPEVEAAIGTYTKAFEAIQASRTLHWRHHLGSVNLDITIDGKTKNFTVSPLHASILYLFKERKSWRLNELMQKTSLPAATLRSRLALWQRNGLLSSHEDRYDLITA